MDRSLPEARGRVADHPGAPVGRSADAPDATLTCQATRARPTETNLLDSMCTTRAPGGACRPAIPRTRPYGSLQPVRAWNGARRRRRRDGGDLRAGASAQDAGPLRRRVRRAVQLRERLP